MDKYKAKVLAIGELAIELLQQGIVVLFDSTAPKELQEIAIVHTGGTLTEDVTKGDSIILGDSVYTVTAVGELANRNLNIIGHVCLKFDARTSPELPGDIHLEGEKLPLIAEGDTIAIKSADV
ncbi:MAG: PTS glucitol/sorbitol transporter subunit IIA [Tepidanaerobacteraceae bacterium]|jgi:PTS system glucitol/sorbitol-specific IIA component